MKPKYSILDGEERHQQHPDTFLIPSVENKLAMQVHDRVKIGVQDAGAYSASMAERIWLRLTKVDWPDFTGEVTSFPVFKEAHGVDHGTSISFGARHIIDTAFLHDGLIEVSLFKLLSSNTIRQREPLCCLLDDRTFFAVTRGTHSPTVEIHKRFPITGGLQPEMLEFLAAANRFGLKPGLTTWSDESNDGDTVVFTIPAPIGQTGEQIWELVERTLESVKGEMPAKDEEGGTEE